MKIEVKTAAELKKEKLVTEQDIKDLPQYFTETVALIFPNKQRAAQFIRDTLVPKLGADCVLSLWSCLTGPARVESLAKALGYIPDNDEKWLLFKETDYETKIKPLLEN